MREIIFRAYDSQKKCYVSEFDLVFSQYGDTTIKLYPNSLAYIDDNIHGDEERQFHRFTLEQFTGLKDKNGVEIYEGDICRIMMRKKYGHSEDKLSEPLNPVKYSRIAVNDNSLYVFDTFNIDGMSIHYLLGQELEVIGNIHQTTTEREELTESRIYELSYSKFVELISVTYNGRFGNNDMQKKYWCKESDGTYTACDNSTGDAWTEHFNNFEDVKRYLVHGVSAEEIHKRR